MAEDRPSFENHYSRPSGGMDMLPKPTAGKLPLLITGGSQQNDDWIAKHGDGWMLYPRNADLQLKIISGWRDKVAAIGRPVQPIMEPLYIDITDDPDTSPQPIHLGLRLGINHLRDYLKSRQGIGVNHIALNPRFNQSDIETTLKRLADDLLPDFS